MPKVKEKSGLVTVVGTKKFHFMSDTKWFLKQGFEEVERTSSGFSLLLKNIDLKAELPKFNESVKSGECPQKNGIVVIILIDVPMQNFMRKNH